MKGAFSRYVHLRSISLDAWYKI